MMAEEKKGGCKKVVGVVVLIMVLCLAVVVGGVMWTWESWGKGQWAKVLGEAVEEVPEEKSAGEIRELAKGEAKRPVVATAPIQADEQTYETYTKRDDVLVMVEYYSDT